MNKYTPMENNKLDTIVTWTLFILFGTLVLSTLLELFNVSILFK